MIIGVPRETHRHEHRVGLTPFGVKSLVQKDHTVFVETGAGDAAHFTDHNYQDAGGQIVYSPEEAYRRADIVCRVGMLSSDELDLLRSGSIVCGFHHLAVAPRDVIERLIELETTLISYELVRAGTGYRPIMMPFSQMGGRMSVQIAAHYLQVESGGRGVLLGNVPGVPPPTVLILGAGTLGRSAARQASAMGAHVIVLDDNLRKLSMLSRELPNQIVTVLAAEERLDRYTPFADAVIGAVLIPGERAPFLITEEMVRTMKPGSVIVDMSIDQGGCVETSRPMTPDHPTFEAHGVLHFCVPNVTANIPRTASRALANAALPYLTELADNGLEAALQADLGLSEGTVLYRGKIANARVGKSLDIEASAIDRLIADGGSR
jgi:alanine dehydrogenase